MEQVVNIYAPIEVSVTPNGGLLSPGDTVVIDTNVPATVLYTTDGSKPSALSLGTFRVDAPAEIPVYASTRLRFKAFDIRPLFQANISRTKEAFFSVPRTRPVEVFRDGNNFFRRLIRGIVDSNFYLTEGNWLVPVPNHPMTYLFINRESLTVRVRLLHNGVDVFSTFPLLGPDESLEFPITPTSGENTILVQTEQANVALYEDGLYDEDIYV